MSALIFRGVGRAFLVLVTVASLVFVMVHLSGDPLAGFVPPGASPEQKEVIREQLGLDRPIAVQYADFIGRAMTGDFGESWRARRSAMDIVIERLPATLRLTGVAVVIAFLIGGGLGLLSARKPGGFLDSITRLLA